MKIPIIGEIDSKTGKIKFYKKYMKKEEVKQFLNFENNLLNNPDTFFNIIDISLDYRSKIIWQEFIDWQNSGGKLKDFDIKYIGENNDILYWRFRDEYFTQQVSDLDPFSKEQYKNGIIAVFSFLQDRPQYFKFRNLEGMFNPLRLLLYKFL